MFWNVKTCSNCVNTFFYMHNCDKVCVPKGDPKHMPKHVPNWAELIIVNNVETENINKSIGRLEIVNRISQIKTESFPISFKTFSLEGKT